MFDFVKRNPLAVAIAVVFGAIVGAIFLVGPIRKVWAKAAALPVVGPALAAAEKKLAR